MANSPTPELVELLREQLRDIHTPEPITWWPMAPGWWMLLLLGIACCIAIVYLVRKRRRARKYRHYLTAQLDLLFEQWQAHQQTSTYCQQANRLLKRSMLNVPTAISKVPTAISKVPTAIDQVPTAISKAPTAPAAAQASATTTQSIASVTGSAWLDALESTYRPFSEPTRNALSLYVYQPEAQINNLVDVPNMHAELTEWLLQHRLARIDSTPKKHQKKVTTAADTAQGESS